MDLIERKAFTFEGPNGDDVIEGPIPVDLAGDVELLRAKLVEAVRSLAVETQTKGKNLGLWLGISYGRVLSAVYLRVAMYYNAMMYANCHARLHSHMHTCTLACLMRGKFGLILTRLEMLKTFSNLNLNTMVK